MKPLPFVTAGLPGTGGRLRDHLEDFRVSEIPAYQAAGKGDHVLCRIEKRGLTTFEAVRILARELDVQERDIGTAGLKDKHGVTQQQLSLPPPASPEAALAIEHPQLRVLEASRHGNKLRTGHLRGNRFRLIVRDVGPDALARAQAIVGELERAPGAPNFFGPQRFGKDGRSAEDGRALVEGRRPPRGRKGRLLISAFQSLLFNDYLVSRMERGQYRQIIEGDIAQIHGHHKSFRVTGVAEDQKRLAAGEITATGPMYGHKMMSPDSGSAAAALEAEILARHRVELESFRPLGKLATGTRRALAVVVGSPSVSAGQDSQSLVLEFSLPPGSYATTITREVIKPEVSDS
ncbi:MAG: tRNA pseudouridine(13) synthase TruD [Deltaproteobacteria bacterium]|nr:tRNA pseudouridine(13) synthase TruD [Deltaproteobacteria bacterium]